MSTEMLRRSVRGRSESRLEHLAAPRPVAQCELWVGRVLRFVEIESEELFDFEDARLLALYLDEETEGQLVEDDLRAGDAPSLPPLLVDEHGTVAERLEYRRQRGGVRHLGLLLALPLDGRA